MKNLISAFFLVASMMLGMSSANPTMQRALKPYIQMLPDFYGHRDVCNTAGELTGMSDSDHIQEGCKAYALPW